MNDPDYQNSNRRRSEADDISPPEIQSKNHHLHFYVMSVVAGVLVVGLAVGKTKTVWEKNSGNHNASTPQPHRGKKWLKCAKNKFTWCEFSIFPRKVQQIHIISVSCNCMSFIFKICQTVAGIGITSQFHEFLNLIFGGFLSFGPTVLHPAPPLLVSSSNFIV